MLYRFGANHDQSDSRRDHDLGSLPAFGQQVVNGQAAFADWNQQQLGLRHKITVPDVLIQPHMASLQMTFYTSPSGFPQWYHRAGYEVIRIPLHNGVAEGNYEGFLTGIVTKDGQVWGRPLGVTIAPDGSMFVTDDGSRFRLACYIRRQEQQNCQPLVWSRSANDATLQHVIDQTP
jgi:hypothetical protein